MDTDIKSHADETVMESYANNMFIESVARICREYSSVIDEMELDTTSRQVRNPTESVGG